jgi:photosystem II stability/assembly factor-like uncharacterized protein
MRSIGKYLVCLCIVFMSSVSVAQWIDSPRAEAEDERFDHPEKFDEWFYGKRAFGLGYIPKDARLNALKERDRLWNSFFANRKQNPQSSGGAHSLADISWTPIGPFNIDPSSGSHAGRINCIAVHPTDPNTAYAGAAMGGIWKTTNGGQSWRPISDNAYSLAFGAIAIDPTNPNIIYAGTGEQTSNIDAYYGVGLLKSTDGGSTWNPSGLDQLSSFCRIIVHPTKHNIIYAAGPRSGGAVYISTDAGASWSKAAGLPATSVSDLVLCTTETSDVLYAGLPSLGTYRSTDGGQTWVNVHTYFQMRRIMLDVDPNNWKDVIDMDVNNDGSFGGIFRSSNGGNDWTDISAELGTADIFSSGGSQQGWYDAYVHRDPKNPDHILVGGISIWLSEDGGGSWVDAGLAYKGGIHPDQHYAAFSGGADTKLYVSCDGGIAVSSDKGATYDVYQDSLAVTQFYGMSVDQNVADLNYGGTQDNGTLRGSRTNGWQSISGGDGGTVVADEDNSNLIFYCRPGDGNSPRKILNGNDVDASSGINSNDSVNWVKPLVLDQANNILYYGTQFLYVSTNKGTNWTKRSKKLDSAAFVNCIEPGGDGKILAVGTTSGKLWYSGDNGITWQDRRAGLPGRSVECIRFSPADKNVFYVAVSGYGAAHVFKTTDKGTTYTDISSSLPDVPCNTLFIDPDHPTELYVGTDVGVFYSPNDGGTWMPYGSGLPNVAISDMAFHKTQKVLRVATHGRSMWEAPLADNYSAISTPNIATRWIFGDAASIEWYGVSGSAKVEITYDGGANWTTLDPAFSGQSYPIAQVSSAGGFQETDKAMVRVSATGQPTLLSSMFRIIKSVAGTTTAVISEQPLYMYDLAYVPEDNVLWVTNFTATDSKIYKIDPDNGKLLGSMNLGSGKTSLTGIKYFPKNQHFYIHQRNDAINKSYVYEVTKTGQIVHSWESPSVYGTGIYPSGDTLFLADRDNNIIYRSVISDPQQRYDDMPLERQALFGPRCISFNPVTNELLHTWTSFQGTTATDASLYDSYLLRLDPATGKELSSYFVQEGGNAGTNVRGCEYDPRSNGTSVWVTALNSGNSSKILKISLKDGSTSSVRTGESIESLSLTSYPNPFVHATNLDYTLAHPASVRILVRDILGREVKAVELGMQAEGSHSVSIDLASFASGSYLAEIYINGERAGAIRLAKEQ